MTPFKKLIWISFVVASFGFVANQSWGNKSGVSPNVLVLPSGPGSIGGVGENVQANLNMGIMSYPISIELPQGRITPIVGLSYSSSAGAGLMGIGWGLNAGGSVERMTVRGLPTYSNRDHFYAGGELVKIPSSPFYRARHEGGFVRYTWKQTGPTDQRGYWIAEHPTGNKSYYGADSKGNLILESQVYGSQGTFRWELCEQVDRNGNRIKYQYTKDPSTSQVYLQSISWLFGKNGKALYQAIFRYEARPDPISDGKPGFDFRTTKRVKELYITSGGQRLRSYAFAFEVSSGLSRLVTVKRFGRDSTKAHPVQFRMSYSDATFSPTNSRMVTLPTSVGVDFRTGLADLVDINGDGLPDIVDTSKQKHLFHINTLTLTKDLKQDKHDFPKSATVENPTALSAQLKNPSVQLLDFNGDGFTDMVDAVTKQIYINRGASKWEVANEKLGNFPINGKDVNMRFFEYNGDKAIDIISSNGDSTTYWVSDNKGNWKRVDGGKGIGASFSKDKVRLIDINGDGLSDAVQIYGGKLRYKKYLGYGKWSGWIDVKVPGLDKYKLSDKAQFSDINGDGMADMVAFLGTSILYFVNRNGMEFSTGQQLKSFKGIDIPDSTKNSIRIADINGNGSRDIVWFSASGKVTYLELFSKRPNLLTEITNGLGQRIQVEYGSSVYHRLRDEANGRKWISKLPMPFTVLNVIKTAAENDKSLPVRPQVQRIYYHDGFYDGKEKKFRGFREVENVFDGDSSAQERKDILFYNVGEQDAYFHGKLIRRVITDGKGKIYSELKNEWKDCGTPAGVDKDLQPPVRFICQSGQEQVQKEGLADASLHKRLRKEFTYDTFGNMILFANLGIKDQPGDEKYTRRAFITPTNPKAASSNWLIRAHKTVEYCEDLKKPCALIRYYFDGAPHKGLPLGQITKGNLVKTSARVNLGEDTFATPKTFAHDNYGNIIEMKTSTGATRKIFRDAEYSKFITKETLSFDGKTYTTTATWDYALGKIRNSTDLQGNVSFYTYDNFGRLLSIGVPGDTAQNPSMTFAFELKAPMSQQISKRRSKKDGPFDREEIKCIDGLGRQISKLSKIGEGKYIASNHVEYNARGKMARTWTPYISDGSCRFKAPEGTTFTSYSYDGLMRPIKNTRIDGSFSRTVYKPLQKQMFDPEDNDQKSPHFNTPTTLILDGLGRTHTKIEMSSTSRSFKTKFQYSLVNIQGRSRIIGMTFPNGTQKQHEYNLLGNITKTIDPDRSTITFKYDQHGNVIERSDARGLSRVYTYDSLARKTSLMQKGKPETRVQYFYDTPQPEFPKASQLKGRLSGIKYPLGHEFHTYDSKGSILKTQFRFMGVDMELLRTYDHMGQLAKKTFPDKRTLNFTWDALGRVVAMPELIKEMVFTPEGMISTWTCTNGVGTRYSYDKLHRLKGIEVGGGKIFSLELTLDHIGNPTKVGYTNGGAKQVDTIAMDAMYRLSKVELSGGEVLQLAFDDMHNLTQKISSLGAQSPAHVGKYTHDSKKIHAASSAGPHKMSYSKSGNLLTLDNTSYQWDYLNRLVAFKKGGAVQARSWYGKNKRRMMREENGIFTFYPMTNLSLRGGQMEIVVPVTGRHAAIWSSQAFAAKFYDDLAPATGDTKLTAKPDGKITAADAWLYHAAKNNIFELALKKRPVEVNLSKTMLKASVDRLLEGSKEHKTYLHTDHLGSVRAVTDEKGQVLARYDFYPYGTVRKQQGHWTRPIFMGAEWDKSTQTYYYGLRSLNPRQGRWLSADPTFETVLGTEGEFNSYGAFKGNPIAFVDPAGGDSIRAAQTESVLSFIVGGVAATFAIINAINSKRLFEKGHVARKLYGAGATLATVGPVLSLSAAVFRGEGDRQTANILSIVGSAVDLVETIISAAKIHVQHRTLVTEHGYLGFRKTAYAMAGVRFVSTAARLGSQIWALQDPDGPGSTIATVAAVVAGVAGFAATAMFTNADFSRERSGKGLAYALKNKKKHILNVNLGRPFKKNFRPFRKAILGFDKFLINNYTQVKKTARSTKPVRKGRKP